MTVTNTIQIVGPTAIFSPQAASITEGMRKDITKIPIAVDPEEAEKNANLDETLFLDLLQVTNDIALAGYICDGDIPGKTTSEIIAIIKNWMRTSKLVHLNYRGIENYGERPGRNEAWIIEVCSFDDEETERTAAEEEGNDYLAPNIIKVKFTMKLVLGVLTQDYGL